MFYFPGDCIEGSVRLTNGTTESEGRIEVCYTGYWGTICEDTFGIFDGQVVCRQLGYSDGKCTCIRPYLYNIVMYVVVESVEVLYEGAFGADPEGYWFEGLNCIGSENNILDCPQTLRTCNGKHVAIRCSNESGLIHICLLKELLL